MYKSTFALTLLFASMTLFSQTRTKKFVSAFTKPFTCFLDTSNNNPTKAKTQPAVKPQTIAKSQTNNPAKAKTQTATKKQWKAEMGVTLNSYIPNLGQTGQTGYAVSFIANKIYFDMTTNFVFSKGTPLDFVSSHSYWTGKTGAWSFNIGYVYRPNSFDKLAIIPTVGMGETFEIWEDDLAFLTTFTNNKKSKGSAGLTLQYRLNNYFVPSIGFTTFDGLKIGFSFSILPKAKK